MEPQKSSSDASTAKVTDPISDWLSKVSAWGVLLVSITGVFFPGQTAKIIAYSIALALGGVWAVLAYKKRTRSVSSRSDENISPTAMLRGLLPFEDGDRLIGRGPDLQAVSTIIRSIGFRFGVVWGRSGSGKTSFFRAALVPQLRQLGVRPVYLLRPTADPISAIYNQIAAKAGPQTATATQTVESLISLLVASNQRTIILIDQFEEFFLLNRTKPSIEAFKEAFGRLLGASALDIGVLVAIREDFFAKLQHLAPQVADPTSNKTSFELENLRVEKAREILTSSTTADHTLFEPSLIEEILTDLEVDGLVRPTELQLVATHLKRRGIITSTQYGAMGRTSGILSSYIKDELRRSGNEPVARLLLRAMCSDDGQTKSPTDLTLDDCMKVLKEHGLSPDRESVHGLLIHFVEARIFIYNDGDKYNLVHDFFASLAWTAIQGLETLTERATRLLRRYVAQYKDHAPTRIPLRDLWFIRRHANPDMLVFPSIRQLLRKSWQRLLFKVLVPVGILALSVLGVYFFLSDSYYLSTKRANYRGGSPFIVVRAGSASLKLMPKFDKVIVDTDYGISDLMADDAEAADAFPRGTITGFRSRRKNGYSEWIDGILRRLSPLRQAEAYRLLGDPLLARDSLLMSLTKRPSEQFALSLGSLARVRPSVAAVDLLKPIAVLAAGSSKSELTRLLATLALTELAKDGAILPSAKLMSFEEIIAGLRRIMEVKSSSGRVPLWEARPYLLALASLAQATPGEITANRIQITSGLLSEDRLDMFVRRELIKLMPVFGAANPAQVSSIVRALIDVVIKEKDRRPSWYAGEALTSIISLAQENPKAVTAELLRPLIDWMRQSGDDRLLLDGAIVYSQLVQANPSIADPSIIARLKKAVDDPSLKPVQKGACAIGVTRLGATRAEWSLPTAVSRSWDVLRSPAKSEMSWLRRYAASALTESAEAGGTPVQKLPLLIEESIDTFSDQEASQELPAEKLAMNRLLARQGHLSSNLVSQTAIRMQIDAIEKPVWSGQDYEAALCLVALAKFNPLEVIGLRKKLYDLPGGVNRGLGEGNDDVHLLIVGALARAMFERTKSNHEASPEITLIDKLQSKDDRDSRAAGVYGLFLLALEDSTSSARLAPILDNLGSSVSPEIRIAAHRVKEMIRVAQVVSESRKDRRLVPLNRSKLEMLRDSPDVFIRLAAEVSLEEL